MEINQIEESPGYLIESLSRNMRRYSAKYLREKKVSLTLEQIAVLTILKEHGSKYQHELAHIMSKDNPTLTRILDLLEKKSYLQRKVSAGDRRKFRILLTSSGDKILTEIFPIVKEIRSNLFQGISDELFEQFKVLKDKIESNISIH